MNTKIICVQMYVYFNKWRCMYVCMYVYRNLSTWHFSSDLKESLSLLLFDLLPKDSLEVFAKQWILCHLGYGY